MQIRCYRCGWSFAIKQGEAAFALEALEDTGGTHYDTNCPRCRHSNRVSLEQLRKAVPRSAEEPEAPEQDSDQEPQSVVEESESNEQNEDGSAEDLHQSESERQEIEDDSGEPESTR